MAVSGLNTALPDGGAASTTAGRGLVGWLSAAWSDLRNRLLAQPGFQRRAAAFALTRPIARRHARAVFDLCAGFVYTQVLYACVRLGVLERLAFRTETVATLAAACSLPVEGARCLLEAAASLGLVECRSGGRYALGARGAVLLGNPAIRPMIEHHALFYRDLADPIALLRGERADSALASHWAYAGAAQPAALDDAAVADYSALMSASQPLIAGQLLAVHDFARQRCLLDVGGGEGTFIASVAAACPHLEFQLFDLPAVAARARQRLGERGLAARVSVHGGDFKRDPLPRGADVVSLVRVLHDHDDDVARALLAAVRACLAPGGEVLVIEPMQDAPGAAPMGAAYFGFYLRAMGSGRPRSAARIAAMLVESGFVAPRLLPTALPLQASVVSALVPKVPKS